MTARVERPQLRTPTHFPPSRPLPSLLLPHTHAPRTHARTHARTNTSVPTPSPPSFRRTPRTARPPLSSTGALGRCRRPQPLRLRPCSSAAHCGVLRFPPWLFAAEVSEVSRSHKKLVGGKEARRRRHALTAAAHWCGRGKPWAWPGLAPWGRTSHASASQARLCGSAERMPALLRR